ncbi:hypothetical protein JCM10213_003121 [Rhodosporidiobolus nylandii]
MPPPSPPPARLTLLSLPPETLDLILLLTLPSQTRLHPRTLARLLGIHRTLDALIRRRLYRRFTLVAGHPRGGDRRGVELLEKGAGGGALVKSLKLRTPTGEELILHPQRRSASPASREWEWDLIAEPDDPAVVLLPRAVLSQPETVALVTRAVRAMKGGEVRSVEWELRCGTRVDRASSARPDPPVGGGEEEGPEDFGGQEEVERLEDALRGWTGVETLSFAVEDAGQRLQVLSTPSWTSPLIEAMTTWDTLTSLDLWRVRLVLPPPSSGDNAAAQPKWRLKSLRLTQSTFSRKGRELGWFGLLTSSSDGGGGEGRGTRLEHLTINDCDFLPFPSSSSSATSDSAAEPHPLLTLFSSPPFASSLKDLSLTLRAPLSAAPHTAESSLLSPLTGLERVELAGAGVSPALYGSLFTPSTSATLQHLTLTYLTHPSHTLSSLLAPLTPSPSSSSSSTSYPANLKALTFFTGFPLPRLLPWSLRRVAREPVWSPLSVAPDAGEEWETEADREREAWEEIVEACRALSRARVGKGEGEAGLVGQKVRLWKNRFEVRYSLSSSPALAGRGGSDTEEEDGSDDEERELNALYSPSPGAAEELRDEEEEDRAWVRRRMEEEEEEEE